MSRKTTKKKKNLVLKWPLFQNLLELVSIKMIRIYARYCTFFFLEKVKESIFLNIFCEVDDLYEVMAI